jgi:hypothetical protein
MQTMREVIQNINAPNRNSLVTATQKAGAFKTIQGSRELLSPAIPSQQATHRAAPTPPPVSAVDTLYQGNGKRVNFTATFSNVWAPTNDFRGNKTPASRMEGQQSPKSVLLNLERQVQKMERIKHKEVKEKVREYYAEKYGIEVSQQDQFFLSPEQLRDKLIKKASAVQLEMAATRIQRWFKSH